MYLMTHSTHFIYCYMASDIWYRTNETVREENHSKQYMGYSFRLQPPSSHRHESTYYSLCYTSHGALAGTRNSSMVPPGGFNLYHERMLYHRVTSHSTGICSQYNIQNIKLSLTFRVVLIHKYVFISIRY